MNRVQAKRCLKLAERLEQLKPRQFEMGNFGTRTACGTSACVAGHAAMIPIFKRLGLRLVFVGPLTDGNGDWWEDGRVEFLKNGGSFEFGQTILGLTHDQCSQLFFGDWSHTAKQKAKTIRRLVAAAFPETR